MGSRGILNDVGADAWLCCRRCATRSLQRSPRSSPPAMRAPSPSTLPTPFFNPAFAVRPLSLSFLLPLRLPHLVMMACLASHTMQHARVPALGQPADSSPHTRTHGCRTPCLDRALSFFLCAGWQALCDADVGCALLPGRSPRSRRLPRATRTSSRSASPALRYLEPKVDLCLPWRLSPACLDADVLPPVLKIPAFPAFSACPDFCVQRAYVHVRVRACTVHRVTCKLTRTPRCQVRCTLGEMSEVMAEIFGCALLLPPPLSPFASSALFLSNARS